MSARPSKDPITFRPFRDDRREISTIAKSLGKPERVLLRELVREALRVRRIRRTGRDEVTAPVRDAQREVVREELTELKAKIDEFIRQQDQMSFMIEDLHQLLLPLIFELLFDAATDARMARDVLLRNVLLPTLPASTREQKSGDELVSEFVSRALAATHKKTAEIRLKIVGNPLDSRRYTLG